MQLASSLWGPGFGGVLWALWQFKGSVHARRALVRPAGAEPSGTSYGGADARIAEAVRNKEIIMRIQHNIASMNAYRNYNLNNKIGRAHV